MKKITLIVPDTITCTYGGETAMESIVNITREIVFNLISKRPDYHEEYYFKDPRDVKISIEDYRDEDK